MDTENRIPRRTIRDHAKKRKHLETAERKMRLQTG
jgi:hypothetical protein